VAIPWLLFPLVLGLLAYGCGLLVESAAGVRLPFALLPPVGFALIVCVTQLATMSGTTASLTTPAVVACAVVGIMLALGRLRVGAWPLAAAVAADCAYAAPTALSGRATFAGYIKLDDTATYLAMFDRVVTHGRSLAGLAPSTYEATLATSLDYGYPAGSFVPLDVGRQLLGTDPAWLWQPYIAFLGALLALALYALVAPLIEPRPLRAFAALIAAQPALLYGYSLWGGLKEVSAAALLAAAGALLRPATRAAVRGVVPLGVVAAALLGVLSIGGAAWVAPLLAAVAVALLVTRGVRLALTATLALGLVIGLLSLPPLVAAVEWLPRSKGFTSAGELGNLIRPLHWFQVFGIWPVGDFRRSPADADPAYVLMAVAGVAALGGIGWAVLKRRWEIVAYGATVAIATLAIVVAGSPWVGAKALATAAPAAVILAAGGSGLLVASGRRVEAVVVGAAIAAGVLWSNVLAYREVWLAPRQRLGELEEIGKRFAGQGPALMTEFEPYGVRHFLRRLDPEGSSELRRRLVALRSGQPLPPQGYADIDRIRLSSVLAYRTLVLRRSPVASVPPSPYRLVFRGDSYDVWQRTPGPTVLAHLPLGNELDPARVSSCAAIQELATTAGAGTLVAVERAPVVAVSLASLPHPVDWGGSGGAAVYPDSDGAVAATFSAPRGGLYGIWIGGSFVGRVEARVDGESVGRSRHQLEWTGQFVELTRVRLSQGRHEFEVTYGGGGIRPGSHGSAPFPLGPLVVAPVRSERRIAVATGDARALCGRRLDWVEALGSR
jgi:hypothetical protein